MIMNDHIQVKIGSWIIVLVRQKNETMVHRLVGDVAGRDLEVPGALRGSRPHALNEIPMNVIDLSRSFLESGCIALVGDAF